jgi:hypothetical protein
MQAISRVITRVHFKDYNIPESFGEEAQIIILPVETSLPRIESESYQLMKLQEKSGMMQMLNEPEEDVWNEFNDDINVNWQEHFCIKR